MILDKDFMNDIFLASNVLWGKNKKETYCAAFHNFKIDACAAVTDDELEK